MEDRCRPSAIEEEGNEENTVSDSIEDALCDSAMRMDSRRYLARAMDDGLESASP